MLRKLYRTGFTIFLLRSHVVQKEHPILYVTDGNIMYLTDASRFLISNMLCDSTLCTCGGVRGVEEQMHNVDYDPGP
jgi:hypothetical protein